ncbi:MAG: hypothetical protein KKF48_05950 [Nanoarchaeota archaeon]|nr:hypothetical protein [Nanoarchaeota archaeon]
MGNDTSNLTEAQRDKLVAFMESSAEGRTQLALADIDYFASYYLKTNLLLHQLRWSGVLDTIYRGGIIAPPGHGKTRCVQTKVIREICDNRNIRVLIISKSTPQAEKRVVTIRDTFEFNQRLIAEFGVFKPPYVDKSRWRQKLFEVVRPEKFNEGTVEGVGLLHGITGDRVDLIILDDLIDHLNCISAAQREKILEYVLDTIETRLDEHGRLWFIGTRFHPYDLYQSFIDNPFYKVVHDRAIIREPKHEIVRNDAEVFDSKGRLIPFKVVFTGDDEGECLAPKLKSMSELLLTRKRITSRTFNRIYQGDATSDDVALIKSTWLNACKDPTRSYGEFERSDYMLVVEGNDPAVVTSKRDAEAKDSDYTVSIVLGVKENRHYDLLGLFRDRGLTPNQIKQVFIDDARNFEPDRQFIETNAHGEIIRWKIKNETNVPIVKHVTTGKSKHDPYEGLTSVAVLFENTEISLPYKTERDREITDCLCNELNSSSSATGHDDQLSALWIAHAGARRLLQGRDRLEALKKKRGVA